VAQTKFLLDEKDLPSRWYNIQADLPAPFGLARNGSLVYSDGGDITRTRTQLMQRPVESFIGATCGAKG
jgi:predicted alternative tryptophan synthase beta-subunit